MPSPGEVVRLRTMRIYHVPPPIREGMIHEDWTAPEEHVYVCLVMGVEPRDGSKPLNVVSMLEALGWKCEDEELRKQWEQYVVDCMAESERYRATRPARSRRRSARVR
jgi:hypothetical protein